jgi:hypothetical protein
MVIFWRQGKSLTPPCPWDPLFDPTSLQLPLIQTGVLESCIWCCLNKRLFGWLSRFILFSLAWFIVNQSFLQAPFFSSKATKDCNVLSRTVSYWLERARATHLVRPAVEGKFIASISITPKSILVYSVILQELNWTDLRIFPLRKIFRRTKIL